MSAPAVPATPVVAPRWRAAPNELARRVAAATWGPVQRQHALAPGVYVFSTAGHGGVVAVTDVATIEPAALDAAHAAGLVERYLTSPRRRAGIGATASFHGTLLQGPARADDERYTRWAERTRADGWPVTETFMWVGEEDCDFATVLLGCPAARAGWRTWARTDTDDATLTARLRATCEQWQPEFIAVYDALRDRG